MVALLKESFSTCRRYKNKGAGKNGDMTCYNGKNHAMYAIKT